jgi:hypothetical protein
MSRKISTEDPAQSSLLGFSLEQPGVSDAGLLDQPKKHVQHKL